MKKIIVDRFGKIEEDEEGNREVKSIDVKFDLRFLDSLRFMQSFLASLAPNLQKYKFCHLKRHIDDAKLMMRKEVFLHDYFDSIEKMSDTKLLPKEGFFSWLNNEQIKDED